MLFTFPSQYWFAIGLSAVFSLGGWFRRIQTGSHVSRLTQDTSFIINTFPYWGITFFALPFQVVPVCIHDIDAGPTTPTMPKHCRFGLFPFRSPLLWESLLFSLPPVNEMFQFTGFASCIAGYLLLDGLSHSDIYGSKVICTSP